jgi:hypothetical protein
MAWANGFCGSWRDQREFPESAAVFDPEFKMYIYLDETGFPWSPRSDAEFIAELEDYLFDPTDVTVVGFPNRAPTGCRSCLPISTVTGAPATLPITTPCRSSTSVTRRNSKASNASRPQPIPF